MKTGHTTENPLNKKILSLIIFVLVAVSIVVVLQLMTSQQTKTEIDLEKYNVALNWLYVNRHGFGLGISNNGNLSLVGLNCYATVTMYYTEHLRDSQDRMYTEQRNQTFTLSATIEAFLDNEGTQLNYEDSNINFDALDQDYFVANVYIEGFNKPLTKTLMR